MSKSVAKDMTIGNPLKLIVSFSVPMLIGNLFQQLYNMVDSIVVGKKIGPEALAAVGNSGTLTFFMFSILIGLCSGISIVLSQYFGAKDEENVKKSFVAMTYIVLGVAAVTGIFGYFTSEYWLKLINVPSSAMKDAVSYMKISCVGIFGIAIYNAISFVLKSLGDSITPLICLAAASFMNIVLDIVFVMKFNWGVSGVAFATVLSQTFSAVACCIYAFMKITIIRIKLKNFKPDKAMCKQCMSIGGPVAIQNGFVACSAMVIQTVTNGFGESVAAAATAVNKVEQIIMQPGVSIGVAISTFTGQNMGAGKIDRVKDGFKAATKLIIGFSLILLPIIFFGADSIMHIFLKADTAKDMEVIKYGIEALRITCFFYSFVGMIFVSRSLLSGAGAVKVAMVMGCSEVICRVLFANVLSQLLGSRGIWWATGINWLLTSLIGIIYYKNGKWKEKSIINKLNS